ncbi:MAG TPA: hypothetical protein VGB83_06700 [Actinomycetota bacterium]
MAVDETPDSSPVRMLVTTPYSNRPIEAEVLLEGDASKRTRLIDARTDERGRAEFDIDFPADYPGNSQFFVNFGVGDVVCTGFFITPDRGEE